MNMEKKIFLEIIECIAKNSKENANNKITVDATVVDINTIYEYARKNKLVVAVFETTQWINIKDSDLYIYNEWKASVFNYTIKQINRNHATSKIIDLAKKRGIKAIIFKGLVLANLYQKMELRTSSDTDILTDRDCEQSFVKLLKDLGYVKIEEKSKDEVYNFYNEEYGHLVELHFCLWEDFKGGKLDVLEELRLEEATIEVVINGEQLTTLNENSHLTYMIFHLIKHYVLEGANLRFLLDMSMFINKYEDRIDWKVFWRDIEKLGYTEFTENIFSIMIKYMNMTPKAIQEGRYKEDNTKPIIDDLFNAGVRGDLGGGFQMLGIMTPYLTGESTGVDTSSGIKRKLSILFPSVKSLDAKRFWYAKKLPILLPLAWIHKWLNFVLFKIKNKGKSYSATEKLKAAENRINLLKDSGLIK